MGEDGTEGYAILAGMFEAMGTPKGTSKSLTSSWARATQKQYTLMLKRCSAHYTDREINSRNTTLLEGIDYLQVLFVGGAHTPWSTQK